ncbi:MULTISPECIES: hypothetical protein [unclassified Microcoleus]|uniref:hypothetical protein n=1 Tax=unclassified Microcoleus TaxID=2642155 RepID=UPI001D28E7A2|nr:MULTISPECIES: hypothetical protein [unclassified Microcoleus]MCC3444575.1 hypothetical protein [Microcoleus sp. PH2017_03_ELD_O_A]MCC3466489.1 hypothetical protein [Microcoleus sp. PH2017_06_SFM_O_A]MCC3501629.1 hypothetical protein [Microcoleus sp. PH2017_19_SFW_U_A]MCC3520473.1 hypothetical protein [Microcoleus sp. PH2017_20_SFW_D_A]MCC3545891.1 hypothetical protein [Microcoleus sp. PH2017_24_DOB_U_A]MCC3551573.1 hypothetical protein [Microcoleus sp. PH2017_35_SFW_U_B]MCC3565009.1 hypot
MSIISTDGWDDRTGALGLFRAQAFSRMRVKFSQKSAFSVKAGFCFVRETSKKRPSKS